MEPIRSMEQPRTCVRAGLVMSQALPILLAEQRRATTSIARVFTLDERAPWLVDG